MEFDESCLFDGRLHCDHFGGIGGQEFFVDGKRLDIFGSWVGLYGALLLVEGRLGYDHFCDPRGCVARGAHDCEGVEAAGFGAFGRVDIGRGVVCPGVEHLFWARLAVCLVPDIFGCF